MSDSITLTIPAFSPEEIAKLETEYQVAEGKELEAIRALRETYGPLAKHGGFIQTAEWSFRDQNRPQEISTHHEVDGRKVRGFEALDTVRDEGGEYTGPVRGTKLYLTEDQEWLELTVRGHWTVWQNATSWWSAGPVPNPEDKQFEEGDDWLGTMERIADEDVALRYSLAAIIKTLAESLKGLQDRLPTRFKKLRERAALAEQVVTSLAGGACPTK